MISTISESTVQTLITVRADKILQIKNTAEDLISTAVFLRLYDFQVLKIPFHIFSVISRKFPKNVNSGSSS